jgi:hypothetical protein
MKQQLLRGVFSDLPLEGYVYVVPVVYKLASFHGDWSSEAIGVEKDVVWHVFTEWAMSKCQQLREMGWFADCTDPASGLPLTTSRGPSIYDEVAAYATLTKCRVLDMYGCSLVEHPKWGQGVYLGTLVAACAKDTGIVEGV